MANANSEWIVQVGLDKGNTIDPRYLDFGYLE